jgi:integrase
VRRGANCSRQRPAFAAPVARGGRAEAPSRTPQLDPWPRFKTRREAERGLTELLGRVGGGTYVEASRETVADFLREWLAAIEARGLRPNTLSTYRMLAEKHLIPRLGSIPLQKLSASHLNTAYADMLASGRRNVKRAAGLSPRTVRYAHSVIRKALADAVKWNRLARNVADAADPPRKSATVKAPKTWTAAELRSFLEHVESDRLAAAWRLAAATGLRRGEVLGLASNAVDLENARLAVRQTLTVADYKPRLAQPKTERSRREVALDADTVAALREHRKRQLEERLAAGELWQNELDLVFTDAIGRPVHPQAFSEAFERRGVAAGLRRIPLHGLRHTHATLALQAGVHPKVVSDRLGHYSAAFTLHTYSDSIPALQEGAAAAVAALVATASGNA